jgi:phenylpyruvate tautomerase PptA (4-oxalocrotonate tautomerase family)
MAQVIIYSHRENLAGRKKTISDIVHASVTSVLGLPQEKRFHRFIALERDDFVHPPDRSLRYTILEFSIFEGRSVEVKKELIRSLFSGFERDLGISPQDLEITIHESPKSNWGIRGQPGDELKLPYAVEK